MSVHEVVIIRTGCPNLASICAAFERLGMRHRISDNPALVANAPLVVLPGVGAFGPAMTNLRARALDDALRDRISCGRALLAICLGLQLLCEGSDESPGIAGLGVVPGRITRFGANVRVPQMGWNKITPTTSSPLLRPDWVYFANSFRLEQVPEGWAGATTAHGGPFASALQRGTLLACQFHPELSGTAGLALMKRWLALSSAERPLPC